MTFREYCLRRESTGQVTGSEIGFNGPTYKRAGIRSNYTMCDEPLAKTKRNKAPEDVFGVDKYKQIS